MLFEQAILFLTRHSIISLALLALLKELEILDVA